MPRPAVEQASTGRRDLEAELRAGLREYDRMKRAIVSDLLANGPIDNGFLRAELLATEDQRGMRLVVSLGETVVHDSIEMDALEALTTLQ